MTKKKKKRKPTINWTWFIPVFLFALILSNLLIKAEEIPQKQLDVYDDQCRQHVYSNNMPYYQNCISNAHREHKEKKKKAENNELINAALKY